MYLSMFLSLPLCQCLEEEGAGHLQLHHRHSLEIVPILSETLADSITRVRGYIYLMHGYRADCSQARPCKYWNTDGFCPKGEKCTLYIFHVLFMLDSLTFLFLQYTRYKPCTASYSSFSPSRKGTIQRSLQFAVSCKLLRRQHSRWGTTFPFSAYRAKLSSTRLG